jgi:hypothetical protein
VGTVQTPLSLYTIRVSGRLGATALSGFPAMVHRVRNGETELTGLLPDRSALFRVLADVEALGLDLLEVRQVPVGRSVPGSRLETL